MAKEWSGFFYRGCYFPNCVYNRLTVKSNAMDQWDIRPDDVVVVTYMKSGTFWMLNLLSSLYTDLNLLLPATKKVVRLDQFYEDADDVPGSYGYTWAGMDLNWDEWIRAFVDGKVWYGSWLDHVLGWRRFGLEDNVLHVTFEDMKKDSKSVLAKVADFLNRPKSDEELDDVVKKFFCYTPTTPKESRHEAVGRIWTNGRKPIEGEF
ncbi:amine sulfotransferase-like [Ptychodera flava]|uniref:amine sulfotransferase-like n=1 Tax=Ptychodera flava TaxID=63121 RepID=UPI00396A3C1C